MKKFIISYSWQGKFSGGFGNIDATPANDRMKLEG